MFQLAISGLPLGGMYALAALGIVLIYRTTGTLTLAQGAIATASAFVFYGLWDGQGVHVVLAAVVALGTATLLGLVLERIVRAIGEGQVLAQVIATLGFAGLVLYVLGEVFGYQTRFVPTFLPDGTVAVAGVRLNWTQVSVVVIAFVLALAMAWLLTRTRTGAAIRAASQNARAASLAGLNVPRLRAASWATGSLLAGVAGIMLTPLVFLDPVQLSTVFLVKPFAAAVIAGLSGLGVAFAAGLALGAVEGMLSGQTWIPGLTEVVPFVAMVAALLLRRDIRTQASRPLVNLPARRPGGGSSWPALGLLAAAAISIPVLAPADLSTLKLMIYYALISLSLTVLTGWVGQISLAQAALVGIGGFMAAKLANEFGLPFGLVLVLAPLVVVPFAVAVGLPAVRFRGLMLALVTLAFGTLTFFSLFQWQPFTGGLDGNRVPAPSLFGAPLDGEGYAYVMLGVAALLFWLSRNVIRNRVGDAFLAVRESEDSAAAAGINVMATKLTAFSLSGVIAGTAGALYAYEVQTVSFDQYSPFTSFNIFALAVFAGVESLWGAVLAGMLFAGAPVLLDFLPIDVNAQLLSSVGVLVTLMVLPGGLVSLPARVRERFAAPHLATVTEDLA